MKAVGERLKIRILKGIRGEGGVSFLEFAIIALPLFVLLFGILEVGLIFWGTYELDNATLSAARLIRTGQAQTNNTSQTGMIAQICSNVVILTNCTSKLQLNVQNFPNFSSVTQPVATNAQGALQTSFPYEPGGPSTVVLVTSFYEWPLVSFSSLALLSNLADGNRLLQSSAVFRSEPYPDIGG
ncbi:MAG: TadE/TadG family type IV pilus assembly protein [Rhodomicrobium sp.]